MFLYIESVVTLHKLNFYHIMRSTLGVFHSSLSDTTICCQVKAKMVLKMLAAKQWTTKYQALLAAGSIRLIESMEQ